MIFRATHPTRVARTGLLAVAAASVAAALTVAAPSAEAQALDVSCQTEGEVYFSPGVGVLPFPQQTTIIGESGRCQNNSDLPIESAAFEGSFNDIIVSCEAGFEGGGEGSGTITWELENGEELTSSVSLDLDYTLLWTAGISGVITDGPFDGSEFELNLTVSPLDAAPGCVLGGIDEIDYEGAFSV